MDQNIRHLRDTLNAALNRDLAFLYRLHFAALEVVVSCLLPKIRFCTVVHTRWTWILVQRQSV